LKEDSKRFSIPELLVEKRKFVARFSSRIQPDDRLMGSACKLSASIFTIEIKEYELAS